MTLPEGPLKILGNRLAKVIWLTVVLDNNSIMIILGEIIQILRTRLLPIILSHRLLWLLVKTYYVARRLGFL